MKKITVYSLRWLGVVASVCGLALSAWAQTITSFTPTGGSVGTPVTIPGSGFSATPANNTVRFNSSRGQVSVRRNTSGSTPLK